MVKEALSSLAQLVERLFNICIALGGQRLHLLFRSEPKVQYLVQYKCPMMLDGSNHRFPL